MEFRLKCFDEVESTNVVVKQALEMGESEGLVVRARTQTGGYGRQGRRWTSPFGGLYQSLLLRPDQPLDRWPTLGLVVALAWVHTVEALTQGCCPVKVKWPNDVVVGQGKLVGISSEVHCGGICLGTGANVLRTQDASLVVGGKNTPAYLDDFLEAPLRGTPSAIDAAGDGFLEEFGRLYGRWQEEGFEGFSEEYRSHDILLGRSVSLVNAQGDPLATGVVAGIDAGGNLLLGGPAGQQAFASGEVHII